MKLRDFFDIDPYYLNNTITSTELVDNNVHLGMEFEIENCHIRSIPEGSLSLLSLVGDASLRNQGVELLFNRPYKGIAIIRAIEEFASISKSVKAVSSARTSIHVHVDMARLTITEIRSVIVLYTILERFLFEFIGKERAYNLYCVPFYKAEGQLSNIATSTNFVDNINNMCKYSALNMSTLGRFGTLEFRHMHTTFDIPRIKEWVNIILCIRSYAVSCIRYGSIRDMFTELSKLDCSGILYAVFGNDKLLYKGAEYEIRKSLMLASTIVYKDDYDKAAWDFDTFDLYASVINDMDRSA